MTAPYGSATEEGGLSETAEPRAGYGKNRRGKRPSKQKPYSAQSRRGETISPTNAGNNRLLEIEAEMIEAAKNLDFERAAQLRDRMAAMIQTTEPPTWVSPVAQLRGAVTTKNKRKK